MYSGRAATLGVGNLSTPKTGQLRLENPVRLLDLPMKSFTR